MTNKSPNLKDGKSLYFFSALTEGGLHSLNRAIG